MAINLQKGQKVSLQKNTSSGLGEILVNLNWNSGTQNKGIFKSLFAFADSSKENTLKWESIFLCLECEERTHVCTPACLPWQQTVPGAHTLSYRLTVKSAENVGKI